MTVNPFYPNLGEPLRSFLTPDADVFSTAVRGQGGFSMPSLRTFLSRV